MRIYSVIFIKTINTLKNFNIIIAITKQGKDLLEKMGGLHKYMGWDKSMLTDSGGFQMVSLLKLSEVKEEGVKFQSPYDGRLLDVFLNLLIYYYLLKFNLLKNSILLLYFGYFLRL